MADEQSNNKEKQDVLKIVLSVSRKEREKGGFWRNPPSTKSQKRQKTPKRPTPSNIALIYEVLEGTGVLRSITSDQRTSTIYS